MKQRILLLLTLLIMIACNQPLRKRSNPTQPSQPNSASVQTGSFEDQITSSGVARHFRLHVPASYQAGIAVSLILNFHGYGSNSQQEENLTGMSAKADREGFIVVYPDGIEATWHTGLVAQGDADRQFVRDLVAHIESLYTIDPKQIYATGISNGGGMTNRLACNLSDLIAAIAPDSGAYNFWEDCSPARPVPVLAFHGLDDNVVPYGGLNPESITPPVEKWAAAWAVRNGCSPSPSVTTPVDTVTVRTWSACQNNADVILYTLANHGHSWPGSLIMPKSITSQAINATDIMWEFFKAHPMP